MLSNEAKQITEQYLKTIMAIPKGKIHENFWNVYNEQKSERLFKLFGDKLIIEKEVHVDKGEYFISLDIKDSGLTNEIEDSLDECFSNLALTQSGSSSDRELRQFISYYLFSSKNLAKQKFYSNITFISPLTNKKVKIEKGDKISKALKHFISDPVKLEKIQTKYSQLLNDKSLGGTLCLSIHPLDYLTASVNDSGWSSCFTTLSPEDKGGYCASTLCLLNSPNTVVCYLKRKNDAKYNGVTWNNKKWRVLASLGDNNDLLHIGLGYPYENCSINEAIKDVFQELTGKQYYFRGDDSYIEIDTPENMFNDASSGVIKLYATENIEENHEEIIDISPEGSVCPICGKKFEDISFDLVCFECGGFKTCDYCGDIITNTQYSFYIKEEGVHVCEQCISDNDDYFFCEHCNSYHRSTMRNVYQDRYFSQTSYYYKSYVCKTCLEKLVNVIPCRCCGKLTNADQMENGLICYNCLNKQEVTS